MHYATSHTVRDSPCILRRLYMTCPCNHAPMHSTADVTRQTLCMTRISMHFTTLMHHASMQQCIHAPIRPCRHAYYTIMHPCIDAMHRCVHAEGGADLGNSSYNSDTDDSNSVHHDANLSKKHNVLLDLSSVEFRNVLQRH